MSTNYILKNFKNLEHARIPCKMYQSLLLLQCSFLWFARVAFRSPCGGVSTTIFVVSVYDDDEENGKGKK